MFLKMKSIIEKCVETKKQKNRRCSSTAIHDIKKNSKGLQDTVLYVHLGEKRTEESQEAELFQAIILRSQRLDIFYQVRM
jgi:hypothetical protein